MEGEEIRGERKEGVKRGSEEGVERGEEGEEEGRGGKRRKRREEEGIRTVESNTVNIHTYEHPRNMIEHSTTSIP